MSCSTNTFLESTETNEDVIHWVCLKSKTVLTLASDIIELEKIALPSHFVNARSINHTFWNNSIYITKKNIN